MFYSTIFLLLKEKSPIFYFLLLFDKKNKKRGYHPKVIKNGIKMNMNKEIMFIYTFVYENKVTVMISFLL